MLIQLLPDILLRPREAFRAAREAQTTVGGVIVALLLPLALIPPLASYFGTTLVGWSIAGGTPVTLTSASASLIACGYFAGIVIATLTVAQFIRWMSETYGERQSYLKCLLLAVLSATPLYLCGILQAYPIVWLNYVLGLPVLAYSIYLLFTGIHELLGVPKDRAFLFGCAVLAVGMVALVGLLASTVIVWGVGASPRFISLVVG